MLLYFVSCCYINQISRYRFHQETLELLAAIYRINKELCRVIYAINEGSIDIMIFRIINEQGNPIINEFIAWKSKIQE